MASAESVVRELLTFANITLNGNAPEDVQVHNPKFYARVLKDGPLGLGESYMEKWWDCAALDTLFFKLTRANVGDKIKKSKRILFKILLHKLFNFQNPMRAFEVGKKHYDLDFKLFQCMLDSNLNYTCGYWQDAETLEQAQNAKLALTCAKLYLKPGMRVLDIGCGWGGLAKYMAEHFNVEVVGVTISKQQFLYAKQHCHGLPVEIRLQDYRSINGVFDRIVSLGMFEHVGFLNYAIYMQVVHDSLKDDGIFLLHSIGNNKAQIANEWITKYIFPNGMLPSIQKIAAAVEPYFVMEDWHNFGADYDKTLCAWHARFKALWHSLQEIYDERFYRMWTYYLLSCAGAFRARNLQLWQIVFTKEGLLGGYQAPRKVPVIAEAYPNYAKSRDNIPQSTYS